MYVHTYLQLVDTIHKTFLHAHIQHTLYLLLGTTIHIPCLYNVYTIHTHLPIVGQGIVVWYGMV